MNSIVVRIVGALALVAGVSTAEAQDTQQAPIPFEGGQLTITETDDLDKVLAFDGKELARNYVVYLERIVDVGDTKVALVAVGDGGNQCGPATVIVWKPADSDIKTETIGEDCGAPAAAVAGYNIYFVPYLLPGATDTVRSWSPDTGMEVVGTISYAPQPGTGWTDVDASKYQNIVDSLKNEAVYTAAKELLGDQLTDVITGLLTGGGTDNTASGIIYCERLRAARLWQRRRLHGDRPERPEGLFRTARREPSAFDLAAIRDVAGRSEGSDEDIALGAVRCAN